MTLQLHAEVDVGWAKADRLCPSMDAGMMGTLRFRVFACLPIHSCFRRWMEAGGRDYSWRDEQNSCEFNRIKTVVKLKQNIALV